MNILIAIALLLFTEFQEYNAQKCGILGPNCQQISNGETDPRSLVELSTIMICPRGYRMYKQQVDVNGASVWMGCCKPKAAMQTTEKPATSAPLTPDPTQDYHEPTSSPDTEPPTEPSTTVEPHTVDPRDALYQHLEILKDFLNQLEHDISGNDGPPGDLEDYLNKVYQLRQDIERLQYELYQTDPNETSRHVDQLQSLYEELYADWENYKNAPRTTPTTTTACSKICADNEILDELFCECYPLPTEEDPRDSIFYQLQQYEAELFQIEYELFGDGAQYFQDKIDMLRYKIESLKNNLYNTELNDAANKAQELEDEMNALWNEWNDYVNSSTSNTPSVCALDCPIGYTSDFINCKCDAPTDDFDYLNRLLEEEKKELNDLENEVGNFDGDPGVIGYFLSQIYSLREDIQKLQDKLQSYEYNDARSKVDVTRNNLDNLKAEWESQKNATPTEPTDQITDPIPDSTPDPTPDPTPDTTDSVTDPTPDPTDSVTDPTPEPTPDTTYSVTEPTPAPVVDPPAWTDEQRKGVENELNQLNSEIESLQNELKNMENASPSKIEEFKSKLLGIYNNVSNLLEKYQKSNPDDVQAQLRNIGSDFIDLVKEVHTYAATLTTTTTESPITTPAPAEEPITTPVPTEAPTDAPTTPVPTTPVPTTPVPTTPVPTTPVPTTPVPTTPVPTTPVPTTKVPITPVPTTPVPTTPVPTATPTKTATTIVPAITTKPVTTTVVATTTKLIPTTVTTTTTTKPTTTITTTTIKPTTVTTTTTKPTTKTTTKPAPTTTPIPHCPDCLLPDSWFFSSVEWILKHLLRSGPEDGYCSAGQKKRIFHGFLFFLDDRCCCEPYLNPFAFL